MFAIILKAWVYQRTLDLLETFEIDDKHFSAVSYWFHLRLIKFKIESHPVVRLK